jgi:hypothetical protein
MKSIEKGSMPNATIHTNRCGIIGNMDLDRWIDDGTLLGIDIHQTTSHLARRLYGGPWRAVAMVDGENFLP